jgi:hypothetical protein
MRQETKEAHVYFPAKVMTDIKKMAQANRRSVSAEIVLAMENKVREWKSRGSGTNGSKERNK